MRGGAPVGAPELVFDQVNLVVADIDASARFYLDLGADVPEVGAGWSPGSTARHLAIEMANGGPLGT